MLEEEKKELDLEQEADLSEEEEKGTESEDSEEIEEEKEGEDIDYKAEYELLKQETAERIARQDKKILKLKAKIKGEKTDDEAEDEEGESESSKPSQIEEIADGLIEEEIESFSSNLDEQKLIKHYVELYPPKSLRRSDIAASVENAFILANKKKIIGNLKAKRLKKQSDQLSGNKNSVNTKAPESSPRITAQDREMAKRFFRGDVEKWLKYKTKEE